jgi:hypothetical protein
VIRGATVATAAFVMAGCPVRYVAQDAHTGPDGESTGAEVMTLKRGEARSGGEVSFPGGDRVDWKYVELPRSHALDRAGANVHFEWRGSADLSFVVYDDAGNVVGDGGPEFIQHEGGRRTRSAGIDVTGPVFLEVYATGVMDGGSYEIALYYHPPIDWLSIKAPMPPPLGAVPLPYCEGIQVPERDRCQWWPRCDKREDIDAENPNCKWYFDSHAGKP